MKAKKIESLDSSNWQQEDLEKYSTYLFRKEVKKITLVNKNEDILSNGKVVANKINVFFKKCNKYIVDDSNNIKDPIDRAVDKFRNHLTILFIQSKVASDSPFYFNETFLYDR